ncbi:nucleoside diphosphate kinase, partial [Panus rudis PR-1116 ss-1]
QGLVGEVTKRFEAKGFRLLAVRMVQPTIDVVSMHCSDIMNESVRNRVIQYMMSGPIIAMVLEAPDAIRAGRLMINPTKILQPDDKLKKQPPAAGSIRGTYSRSALLNVIHGSDSREAAAREIALYGSFCCRNISE